MGKSAGLHGRSGQASDWESLTETRILCTDPCSFSIPLATDRDTQSDAGSGRSACAVWECLEEQGCAALAGCHHYVLAVT